MYEDEYGFTPLEDRLASRLHELSGGHNAGDVVRLEGAPDTRDDELERLGFLANVYRYCSGDGRATLTSKGAAYGDELGRYEARKRAADMERERIDAGNDERQWRFTVANGVFGIVGAVAGSLITLGIQAVLGAS